jgi:hypothetical protein
MAWEPSGNELEGSGLIQREATRARSSAASA